VIGELIADYPPPREMPGENVAIAVCIFFSLMIIVLSDSNSFGFWFGVCLAGASAFALTPWGSRLR
jgi:hypothetical protein